MNRWLLMTLAAALSTAAVARCDDVPAANDGASSADAPVPYADVKQRIYQIDSRIREIGPQVVSLVRANFQKDIDSKAVDIDRINSAMTKLVTHESIQTVLTELKVGAPGGRELAADEQKKIDAWRAPLDALDATIANRQAEYDRLMDLGWEIDLWGLIEPKGTYGDRLRELYRELNKLQADRVKLKKEIEAKMQADPEVSWKSLDEWQKAADKWRNEYIQNALPGFREIQRLLAELGTLLDEKDRLTSIARTGEMIVVWYNDVGWLHVGSREHFVAEAKRARGSETWGGMSKEPLKNTQVLDTAGYPSMDKAVEAIGKAIGQAELRRAPLAFPKTYYVGKVGGKEVMLGGEIVRSKAFADYMPKPEGG